MRQTVVLLFCAGLLGSCCEPPAAQGDEGQVCYPNDTCNVGLTCIGGHCLGPDENCGNTICESNETELSCPADCSNGTCGNDIIDDNNAEVCDGSELDGQTCVSLGHFGGTLACTANCMDFDETGCHSCGDSVIQIPEVCDASNLGGLTCLDVGYLSGTLACSPDCISHDTSECTSSCEEVDCDTCMSSSCALAACASEIATCENNSDCLALYQCLEGCTDINCQTNCNNQYPQGITDYMAARSCLVCDPNICFDECNGANDCP